LAQIGERPLSDRAALAIALAQQHGGSGAAVRHHIDKHEPSESRRFAPRQALLYGHIQTARPWPRALPCRRNCPSQNANFGLSSGRNRYTFDSVIATAASAETNTPKSLTTPGRITSMSKMVARPPRTKSGSARHMMLDVHDGRYLSASSVVIEIFPGLRATAIDLSFL